MLKNRVFRFEFLFVYIAFFIKGLQINKLWCNYLYVKCSNVRLTTIYASPEIYKKNINGLELLHIIMMFNIGQFICLRKFSYFTCIYDDLIYLCNNTFNKLWDSVCYACNTPMSQFYLITCIVAKLVYHFTSTFIFIDVIP